MIASIFALMEIRQHISCRISMIMGQAGLTPGGADAR